MADAWPLGGGDIKGIKILDFSRYSDPLEMVEGTHRPRSLATSGRASKVGGA